MLDSVAPTRDASDVMFAIDFYKLETSQIQEKQISNQIDIVFPLLSKHHGFHRFERAFTHIFFSFVLI